MVDPSRPGIRVAVPRQQVARRKPTMVPTIGSETRQSSALSPMTLSDRLITLAKDADMAGYTLTAEHLVQLALTIFDEAPRRPEHGI
jgi:hypothetical protein